MGTGPPSGGSGRDLLCMVTVKALHTLEGALGQASGGPPEAAWVGWSAVTVSPGPRVGCPHPVCNGARSLCAQVRFMLDTMLALRNNDMRKIPGYDPGPAERLRKLQGTLVGRPRLWRVLVSAGPRRAGRGVAGAASRVSGWGGPAVVVC